MSRVEPKEEPAPREAEEGRHQRVDRTPNQAEGDEKTVDEALRRQEKKRPED